MEDKELMNTEETALPETETVSEETAGVASADAKEGKGEKPISKKRRIFNAIFLGVQVALVVIALVICMIVILNPNTDEVSPVGVKLLPVLTGSMDGSRTIDGKTYEGFPAGSLVVATKPKNGGYDLQVGDVVTFQQREEKTNTMILVTHRIIERHDNGDGTLYFITQGDANGKPDERNGEIAHRIPGDMLAQYKFHIKGLGKVMTWIRDGYHFIYVIIIPLGLLLIYNIYLVAQIVIENKMKKAKEAAAEAAKAAALSSIDEEEIKRKAIEEYLKNHASAEAGGGSSDDKGDTE